MPKYKVTLENEKTQTYPSYISVAPDFESCYRYEKDVIKRLQKIRPHIKLLTILEVTNDHEIHR